MCLSLIDCEAAFLLCFGDLRFSLVWSNCLLLLLLFWGFVCFLLLLFLVCGCVGGRVEFVVVVVYKHLSSTSSPDEP